MWDLTGPPDAEPMVLGRGPVTTIGAVFEPTGRWLTAEDLNGVTFWPATGRWPSVMRVSGGSRCGIRSEREVDRCVGRERWR